MTAVALHMQTEDDPCEHPNKGSLVGKRLGEKGRGSIPDITSELPVFDPLLRCSPSQLKKMAKTKVK